MQLRELWDYLFQARYIFYNNLVAAHYLNIFSSILATAPEQLCPFGVAQAAQIGCVEY